MRRLSTERLGLITALAAGAAVRAAVFFAHHGQVLFTSLRLDEELYQAWAIDAAGGKWLLDYVPNHGPGYAWALGLLYKVLGVNLLIPRLFQIALGLGSIALAHRIGRRLFGPGAAFAAALLLALYWPLIIFEQHLLAVSLFLFLNLLGLHLVTRAVEDDRAGPWLAAGVVFGVAAITRVNAVPVIAVLAGWLAVRVIRGVGRKRALAFIAAALGPTLLVMIAHRGIAGEWGPVQTNGGLNLYLGNNPDSDGTPYARPGGSWDALESMPYREAGLTGTAQQDRFYVGRVLDFMTEQPGAFAALILKKSALLVNRREVRATIDPEFHRHLFGATRLPLPGFGLIFGLALTGLFAIERKRGGHQVLLLFLAAHGLTLIATVVSSRYRLPFAAGLTILAGAGAWSLLGQARERSPKFLVMIGLFAAGLGLSCLPVAPKYSDAEEWTFQGEAWLNRRDFGRAADYFNRALAADPDHAEAMIGLGRVKNHQGDPRAAVAWLRQAVAADPASARARFQLGIALWDAGEREQAVAEMKSGLARRPQWVPGMYVLATYQLELGRTGEARANLRAALQLRPDYPDARDLLRKIPEPTP